MRLVLRADVHAAIVNDDLVLLDVAADRYVCLSAAGAVASLPAGRQHLETDDHELAGRLGDSGLLQGDEVRPGPRTTPPPRPDRSGLLSEIPPISARDLGPALAALGDTLLHYHRRPFAKIVEAGSRRRTEPLQVTPPLEAAVLRFHAWIPYVTAVVDCYLALAAGRAVRTAADCRGAAP